jgi:hypothetical protein
MAESQAVLAVADPTTPTQQIAAATTVSSPKPKKTTKRGGSGAAATTVSDSKKPRSKSLHPPTSEMVNNAIKTLKERNGSSLQAIKKYISVNYKIDSDKLSPFIKKYLKSGVANLQLIQTKGKGASGSFKLATVAKLKPLKSAVKAVATNKSVNKPKPLKKAGVKKSSSIVAATTATKKSKTVNAVKKVNSVKTSDKKKTVKAVKKSGAGVKSITKQKPTKATKSEIKKVKTPKPKKASTAAAPKKSVAKK